VIQLFVGTDEREAIGLHVFNHSVWSRASQPVSITPIQGVTDGTNAFTLARFLIPYHMGYNGFAIWMDGSDMLCLADIAELWALRNPFYALQVVKHDYKTRWPTKYLGQKNLDYPRKNWSSLMMINCAHFAWRNRITPENISEMSGSTLHRFDFLKDEYIGALPKQWNYLCAEPNQEGPAKIAHFTIGLPIWYSDTEYANEWRKEQKKSMGYQHWVPPNGQNQPSTDASPPDRNTDPQSQESA